MDSFVEKYGEPEEIDIIDEDEDLDTTILHYWDKGFSLFFAGQVNPILVGIETEHPKSSLYGKKIMGMTKEDIIALMAENGHKNYDIENEEYVGNTNKKDLRVSYEESMMDFFFRDNLLVYMNFGVLIDENGDIEAI